MVSFKKAAIDVLKNAEEPLSAKEITDIALQKGLIETEGQTPEATMGAQLYMDINKYKDSPFIKVGRGNFSLRKKEISPSSPLVLIEKQNENVKKALKEKLYSMDPYQFEFFVADLLQKIGYGMCLGETRNSHGDSFVYDGKNFKIKTEASRRRDKRI